VIPRFRSADVEGARKNILPHETANRENNDHITTYSNILLDICYILYYNNPTQMKSTTICFRTTRNTRNALMRLSQAQKRSLSSTIENILHTYVERRIPKAVEGEKRRHVRKKILAPALVRDENGVVHAGTIDDISIGGVHVSVRGDFECGTAEGCRMGLTFTLPESEKTLTMQCVPRHVSGGDRVRIGASFVEDNSPDHRELSHRLMN